MTISMMKKPAALAILCALAGPALAESVDVRVTGTITPPACTPTVEGGGVIDYGNISASSLSATDYTVLEQKTATFTVTCEAPAKFAINAINGRPGSLAGGIEQGPDAVGESPVKLLWGNVLAAGLGMTASNKEIGGYAIAILNAKGDNETVYNTVSLDNGATWSSSSNNETTLYNHSANLLNAWTKTSGVTTGPDAIQVLSADLGVQAYINKTSELDLTQDITLDGLTTIEMVYL